MPGSLEVQVFEVSLLETVPVNPGVQGEQTSQLREPDLPSPVLHCPVDGEFRDKLDSQSLAKNPFRLLFSSVNSVCTHVCGNTQRLEVAFILLHLIF